MLPESEFARVRGVADAVLYEGYMLYPYRESSIKNQQPWTWGVIAPGEALGCDLLVTGTAQTTISARVRYLRPAEGVRADRCEVDLGPLPLGGRCDGLSSTELRDGLFRLELRVRNATDALMASVQAVVAVDGGSFVPLRDPPAPLAADAAACRNDGLWPTLLGAPGETRVVLCAPIILDDHPRTAPESPGDWYDATEIDEMLVLRLLTLSDEEREMLARSEPRVRALLERTLALSEDDRARLHGALRTPVHGLRPGSRVRLRPQARADIFDIALAGRAATVVSLEQDFDGRAYVTVTVDDDPGRDLGETGQPGHRFFFGLDEVEPV